MRLKKNIFIAVTIWLVSTFATAANEKNRIYIYGFASSFNDSIVYITDIQELDSAYLNHKNKFLYNRNEYSYQLRRYLQENGIAMPTCVTIYATSRKSIEKKMASMRKQYTNKKKENYIIKTIKAEDFSYKPVIPDLEGEMGVSNREDHKKGKDKK